MASAAPKGPKIWKPVAALSQRGGFQPNSSNHAGKRGSDGYQSGAPKNPNAPTGNTHPTAVCQNDGSHRLIRPRSISRFHLETCPPSGILGLTFPLALIRNANLRQPVAQRVP